MESALQELAAAHQHLQIPCILILVKSIPMSTFLPGTQRVLALDFSNRSIAYSVFENAAELCRWGLKHIRRGRPDRVIPKVQELLDAERPAVLVLESPDNITRSRQTRLVPLAQELNALCAKAYPQMAVHTFSRFQVRDAFQVKTKHEIAQSIGQLFPELESLVPPHRSNGDPEKEQMNIFDAISFALTYFLQHGPSLATGRHA